MKFRHARVSAMSHVTVHRGVIGQIVTVVVNKKEPGTKMSPTKKLSHVIAQASVFSMLRMILMKTSKHVRFKTPD